MNIRNSRRGFWKFFQKISEKSKSRTTSSRATAASKARTDATAIQRRSERVRIQVGLDFGTSSTKATFRQLGLASQSVQPLLFHSGSVLYPDFCLPSLGAFDTRGRLLLGTDAAEYLSTRAWGEGLTRFKMLVAGQEDSRYLDKDCLTRYQAHVQTTLGNDELCPPDALAAVYLAHVMRLVRRRIQKKVRAESLDLSFNTCVPIDQREHSKVLAAFQRIVATAEWLDRSQPPEEPGQRAWVELAMQTLPAIAYDETNPETRVFVVPEAVASVASYLVSLQKRSGLHALVDIGAGTTDLSIFNLSISRKLGTTSFWYAARSIPLGTGQIEERVARELGDVGKGCADADEVGSVLRSTNAKTKYYKAIKGELDAIWLRSRKGWGNAFDHLRTESEWCGAKVQVFLAGGGSLLPQAVPTFRVCPLMERWGPYPCDVLPEPDGYDNLKGSAPFSRLSVAYGLSTPVPELGKFVLPADSPDHTPPRPKQSERYTSSGDDELIPKYGWT